MTEIVLSIKATVEGADAVRISNQEFPFDDFHPKPKEGDFITLQGRCYPSGVADFRLRVESSAEPVIFWGDDGNNWFFPKVEISTVIEFSDTESRTKFIDLLLTKGFKRTFGTMYY